MLHVTIIDANKTARISGQSHECSDYPLIHIDHFLGKENIEKLYFLDNIRDQV